MVLVAKVSGALGCRHLAGWGDMGRLGPSWGEMVAPQSASQGWVNHHQLLQATSGEDVEICMMKRIKSNTRSPAP
jgi:hypothetical protein